MLASAIGATCALVLGASCGGGSDSASAPAAATSCGAGACTSTVAGSGGMGNVDGMAMAAQFTFPHAVAVDASSGVHVADYGNDGLTRVISGGQVSTPAEDATDFPFPADIAVDAAGNKYVADPYGNRILKIAPDGAAAVFAGTGRAGDEDGAASSATFSMPTGVAFGPDGALYVADMGNRKIRKITFG